MGGSAASKNYQRDCSGEKRMKRLVGKLMMSAGLTATLTFCANSQVTHGMKPDLPKPFSTKSAGNGPDQTSRPDGFLPTVPDGFHRSEEHTSELQSPCNLVCRLLLEKKTNKRRDILHAREYTHI